MARHNGLSFYKRRKKINAGIVKEIFSWLVTLSMAVFLAFVAVIAFGMSTEVVGVSMEPELFNEQKVFISRFAYVLLNPKSGDVISFLPNGNQNSHYYVKRIVGVPGDKVQILDGVLYVNGEKSEFFSEKILDAGIAANELTLPSGEYFCMGDSPNISEDSRSANIGTVKEKDIVGKVWFKLKCDSEKPGFVK